MSTRSIIVITSNKEKETVRLYKHSDGYPTHNLQLINKAIEKALSQCSSYVTRFGKCTSSLSKKYESPNVDQMTGILIGESTCVYGIGARIDSYDGDTAQYHSGFHPSFLGTQCDLEWIYVIDLDKKSVNVYGGRYTGQAPQVAFERGPTNPLNYVDCLMEDYKEKESEQIKSAMQSIRAWGFKINTKTKEPVETV